MALFGSCLVLLQVNHFFGPLCGKAPGPLTIKSGPSLQSSHNDQKTAFCSPSIGQRLHQDLLIGYNVPNPIISIGELNNIISTASIGYNSNYSELR